MTPSALTSQLVEAVKLGVITEQDACEFLIAIKRGDTEAIERLKKEYGEINKIA